MNGHEPLPGLLDDPQILLFDFPSLTEFPIPPLRNPASVRNGNVPSPIEPLAKTSVRRLGASRGTTSQNAFIDDNEFQPPPQIRPSDVLSARDNKKPHLAISELVDTIDDDNANTLQLPSFVSLSVVEKSPIPQPSRITSNNPYKRPRLELEPDSPHLDVNRLLPRPAKKNGQKVRPVPLLPAMVTGLHEPPPSAGLLPSMSDARPEVQSSDATRNGPKKLKMKDILTESKHASNRRPPEAMINSPHPPNVDLPKAQKRREQEVEQMAAIPEDTNNVVVEPTGNVDPTTSAKKDTKQRRARRKWSDGETADLCAGVKKYGFGKWKQILGDSAFTFNDRTTVDLKDRYRVFAKDLPEDQLFKDTSPGHGASGNSGGGTADADVAGSLLKARRKRHPWTLAEDKALMQGVSKHGFHWTAIHGDPDLEWGERRATDLRDRIRTLYPEEYKKAGARPLRSETLKLEKGDQAVDVKDGRAADTIGGLEDEPVLKATGGTNESSKADGKESKSSEKKVEHPGVTLPSLDLDDDGNLEWDNTLPPLLDWEEIVM